MWGTALVISGILVLLATQRNGKRLGLPLARGLVIRNDPLGLGHYHAPRGNRLHKGIDFMVNEGEPVYAPISGRMRFARPYRDDAYYEGISIQGEHCEVKIFYLNTWLGPGMSKEVKAGDEIGKAQAISHKYSPSMIDHIHVEVLKNGKNVDPTNYFI